jgi:KaiC/GvpD/RAD55 family RecA-like ATPase
MKLNSPHVVVTKMLTGIQGFDEITDGGLPRGRTTLVMGGPGCGKTVFALQSLVTGATRRKEAGIFVAFEESTRRIVAKAATFGWDLPGLVQVSSASLARGRESVKRAPFPSALSTVRSPSIARARSRLIANPNPTPLSRSESPSFS